jgi:hypothetical protein
MERNSEGHLEVVLRWWVSPRCGRPRLVASRRGSGWPPEVAVGSACHGRGAGGWMRRRGARYSDPDAQGGDEARRRRVRREAPERLSAGPGRIEFELINERRKGHNIRIHTGDLCCFGPGRRTSGAPERSVPAGPVRSWPWSRASIPTSAPPAAIGAPSTGRWSSDERRAASVAARFRARRAGRSPL